jgi:hypothetical protein
MKTYEFNARHGRITETQKNNDIFESDLKDLSYKRFYSMYTDKLGINFEGTENLQLLATIDEWLGTRYRLGGCSRDGIDCSCFIGLIYKDVYGIELSRSSANIYDDLIPVKKEDLQEGDILFFKTRKNRISHVGIYLKQNKFVHVSRQRGVVIDDLTKSGYYRTRFFSGGRAAEKKMLLYNIIEVKINRFTRRK